MTNITKHVMLSLVLVLAGCATFDYEPNPNVATKPDKEKTLAQCKREGIIALNEGRIFVVHTGVPGDVAVALARHEHQCMWKAGYVLVQK